MATKDGHWTTRQKNRGCRGVYLQTVATSSMDTKRPPTTKYEQIKRIAKHHQREENVKLGHGER